MKNNLNTISMSADGKSAEIQIYSQIGSSFFVDGISAKSFSEALAQLGDVSTLNVRFNTPGGSVFQGIAIYNELNRHPAKKIGHVDALAASIGSVILMACDEINVAENAIVMIHNVRGGVEGEAHEIRTMADRLDKLNENAIGIYSARSGMAPEAVASAMKVETWYSAAEAVAAGFATAVTPNKRIVASCDVSSFSNVPDWANARLQAGTQPERETMARENSKYVAEFKAEPAYAKQMTQDEYVAMRRIDDGLESLRMPGT